MELLLECCSFDDLLLAFNLLHRTCTAVQLACINRSELLLVLKQFVYLASQCRIASNISFNAGSCVLR